MNTATATVPQRDSETIAPPPVPGTQAYVIRRDEEAIAYRARWEIELLFHVFKNGCRVEPLQLSTIGRIERALTLDLVVAWRIARLICAWAGLVPTWRRLCCLNARNGKRPTF